MALSRKQQRRLRHAIEKNAKNRFFNLPSELRNVIYSHEPGKGALLETFASNCQLPGPGGTPPQNAILRKSKLLRQDGLEYLYSKNKTRIRINCNADQKVPLHLRRQNGPTPMQYILRPPWVTIPGIYLAEMNIPDVLFKSTRDMELMVETTVTTSMPCCWHVVGLALVVKGDEYGVRIWFEYCRYSQICYDMIFWATQIIGEAYLDMFEDRIKEKD